MLELRFRMGMGVVLGLMIGLAIAIDLPAQEAAPPASVRLLGPLPSPPDADSSGPLAPTLEPAPELDPVAVDPWSAAEVSLAPGVARVWRDAAPVDGKLRLEEPGVYWIAALAVVNRWTGLTVMVNGGGDSTLWVDRADRTDGDGDAIESTVDVARGSHLLVLRVETDGGDDLVLEAAAKPAADLRWGSIRDTHRRATTRAERSPP